MKLMPMLMQILMSIRKSYKKPSKFMNQDHQGKNLIKSKNRMMNLITKLKKRKESMAWVEGVVMVEGIDRWEIEIKNKVKGEVIEVVKEEAIGAREVAIEVREAAIEGI